MHRRRIPLLLVPLLALLLPTLGIAESATSELPVVRVATLKYGTANWELEIIRQQQLDRLHGFSLELLPRVSPNASLIAVQGGAADFTVSDWLWAARQRDAGRDFRYFPYSTAVGELVVPADSPVKSLAGLRDREVGVAGGAEDKSWLLFQSYAQRSLNMDLLTASTPRYAAPPLLSALAEKGDIDAVLTYWHYAARLRARGFRVVLSLSEVLAALGISGEVPMLGWVFSGNYAQSHPDRVNAFLRASYAAKRQLLTSDEAWEAVRPLMRVNGEAEFVELRDGYRRGVPTVFGGAEIAAVNRVAQIVRESLPATHRSVDGGARIPADIFWSGVSIAETP